MTKLATIDETKLARQITDQYEKAIGGMVDYIALGALGQQVRAVVSTADTTAKRGPTAKGDGVKGWLEAHAPGVSRPTLYRCMEIADHLKDEFKLGPRSDLYTILKGKAPDKKQLALREKITGFVAGKSQRQLLIGIGQPDAQIGGKRVAKTKPPTEAEIREAWLDDAKQRSLSTFSGLHDLDERWKTLADAELKVALEDAKAFVKEAEQWLKTPAPARTELRVEKFLEEAKAADQGGKQS